MTAPFDDIRALFEQIPPLAAEPAIDAGLAELAPIAGWIARWRGAAPLNRPILCLYAAAHAGAEAAPTRARLEAIAAGDTALNRGLRHLGAGLEVFDLALERPVGDADVGAVMSERECAATMAFGMEALAKQPDLLILMGVGPGSEEAAAGLTRILSGAPAGQDRGVRRALAEAEGDPLQWMRQLGGRETAAVAGAILGARIQGVPVLLDGTPAMAAAALLYAIDPEAVAHCRIAHAPRTPEGRALALRLGRGPLLGLQLGLDDGTAALAALSVVKLAVAMAAAT